MDIHKNACLTPRSRADLVRRVGVCVKTVRKWVARWRAEGEAGLADRSSRPLRLRRPTPAAVAARVGELRRQRWTGKAIAAELGVSPATVSRVLRRLGLSRLRNLQPAEPVRRYERELPGELIHLDIKKLGRFEAVGHRITGDQRQGGKPRRGLGVRPRLHRRRLADRLLPHPADERKQSATAFLGAAVAYYRSLGVAEDQESQYAAVQTAQCPAVPLVWHPGPRGRGSTSRRPASRQAHTLQSRWPCTTREPRRRIVNSSRRR